MPPLHPPPTGNLAIRAHRAGLAALTVAAMLAAGSSQAATAATEPVVLESNVRELYPREKEICVTSYEQMSDTVGVVLQLHSDVDQIAGFRYSIRRDSMPMEAIRETRSGTIALMFDSRSARPQRLTAVIKGFTVTGEQTRPYAIAIAYYPREFYAASGQGTQNWMSVQHSDLELCGGSVDDWIVERPTADEQAFARRQWGRLVAPLTTNREKARAIARDLVRRLRSHEGVPSGRMKYSSGFEQLAMAESGKDHVWCGNYADIFSAACNALDIPVRKIDMQYVWSSQRGTSFEIGESHRTTEVFARGINRWVWMDLTFGCWAAIENGTDTLGVSKLVAALDDPTRVRRLQLLEFDAATGAERLVPALQSEHLRDLKRFFRRDQRYQYTRTARTSMK